MAQVILVYPQTGLDLKDISVWLPLACLNCASTLVKDYDVAIVDSRVDPFWKKTLASHLNEDTLCVGISSMTGTQIRNGLEAARLVREWAPHLPIVWGGNHPTLVVEQTAGHPLVDIVVQGEGEIVFKQLVDRLFAKRDWRDISNIAFKQDGKVVVQGKGRDFVDPNEMPELPYHLVDVEKYLYGRMSFGRRLRSLPFITSSGCPYACTFCCQPVLSNRRWRRMRPEVVAERLFHLAEKYRLEAVEFHDEEFFVDRKRGMAIADLIGSKFKWYVQTRMDDLLALNLDRLEKNGLKMVQPGLETGSERLLKMIRKEETLLQYQEANRALAKTGIESTYNFMMGFPTETLEDLTATVDLSLKLLEENPNAHIAGFYVYVPYPGAELFHLALQEGFRYPASLEEWGAFNRQFLNTPWTKEKWAVLKNLLFTSKLVDGERLIRVFDRRPFLQGILKQLSRRYRKFWKEHRFDLTWDVRLLALAAKHYFAW